jgi:hypothetical protein
MGISVSQMMTAGFRSNIASHREEFPEAKHLSELLPENRTVTEATI